MCPLLKRKLTKEGFDQLYEKIVQLKLASADGKKVDLVTGDSLEQHIGKTLGFT